jgi:hypothetical protein
MQTCPVGRLFDQAGVDTEATLVQETLLPYGTAQVS